jgi:hypothetical protein
MEAGAILLDLVEKADKLLPWSRSSSMNRPSTLAEQA